MKTHPIQDDNDENDGQRDGDVRHDFQNLHRRLLNRRAAIGERRPGGALTRRGPHQETKIGEVVTLAGRHAVTRDVVVGDAAAVI